MKYTIAPTHILDIAHGDTVEHNGRTVTVGKKDIKFSTFMGCTLFGDNYRSGTKPVKKLIIHRALPKVK